MGVGWLGSCCGGGGEGRGVPNFLSFEILFCLKGSFLGWPKYVHHYGLSFPRNHGMCLIKHVDFWVDF